MRAALELFEQLEIRPVTAYCQRVGLGPLETACVAVVERMIRGHGLPHATLTLRTIAQTEGNQRALTEDIIGAISDVISAHPRWANLGLAWLGAFDQIRKIAKDAGARPLRAGIATLVALELEKILGPSRPRKPPARTQAQVVSDHLALGAALLQLEATETERFAAVAYERFKVDPKGSLARRAMAAARLYAGNAEISSRVSWNALCALSAPALPAAARDALERRIRAGERIGGPQIRAARLTHTQGRDQPRSQLAA
jgi:hypothetical protein